MDNRIVNFPTPWKRLAWRKLDERSIEASIAAAVDLLEAAQGAHRDRHGAENAFIRRALLELSLV